MVTSSDERNTMTDDNTPTGERPDDVATHIELMRMRGKRTEYHLPGEITTNDDGELTGVTAGSTGEAVMVKPFFTAEQWEAIAWHLLGELDDKKETDR
jgi:hypothetical protein